MNVICPICKEKMMLPRLYPQCGHTMCEPCMIKNDMVEIEKLASVGQTGPICKKIFFEQSRIF